jgi:hypothetical protein
MGQEDKPKCGASSMIPERKSITQGLAVSKFSNLMEFVVLDF